ncbi:MAG: hypothetical protein IPL32_16270 [Chloracidobacterium sp.]|nr:hypothetical protein [Chloracidobacterium sp.]
MSRKSVVIVGFLIVSVACVIGYPLIISSSTNRSRAYLYLKSTLYGDPEFRYLYAVNGGESRFDNYIYQSLEGDVQYAKDCIGCKEESGDTFFFHSYVSPQMSREIYDRMVEPLIDETARREVLEQTPARDRAMTRISQNGKTISVSLFWIENGELWEIRSIDQRHVIAFQRSQFFQMIKPQD